MESNIIRIGNSKGLRLSKSLLEKYHIDKKVILELKEEGILIKPLKEPRKGWSELFKSMHKHKDDELLIPDVFEDESFD